MDHWQEGSGVDGSSTRNAEDTLLPIHWSTGHPLARCSTCLATLEPLGPTPFFKLDEPKRQHPDETTTVPATTKGIEDVYYQEACGQDVNTLMRPPLCLQ